MKNFNFVLIYLLIFFYFLRQSFPFPVFSDEPIVIKVPPREVKKSENVSLDSFTYVKNGKDWPGLCMTGTHQSPINIIDKINTQEDPRSHLKFQYHLEKDFAESYQLLKYDGRGLSVKVDIGDLIFTHSDGTEEHYKANQIDLHYPSEHTITLNTQSPRFPLEIQIIHRLIKTSNKNLTNFNIDVKKAIVSILFRGDSTMTEGDAFLSRMGIDNRLRRPDGTYRTIEKEEYINSTERWLGNSKPGFDINALIALKDLLNFDHWIFRYYGSKTQPPCNEDAHRFVFALPRSANQIQIDFLRSQLMKERNITEDNELILKLNKYYGNNRSLQIYDDASNGKIYSMVNGISQIEGLEFPKN